VLYAARVDTAGQGSKQGYCRCSSALKGLEQHVQLDLWAEPVEFWAEVPSALLDTLHLVMPKFGSKLMQELRTKRTEPSVQVQFILVHVFWAVSLVLNSMIFYFENWVWTHSNQNFYTYFFSNFSVKNWVRYQQIIHYDPAHPSWQHRGLTWWCWPRWCHLHHLGTWPQHSWAWIHIWGACC